MQFLIDNKETILFLGVLVAILLSSKYLIPFLKNKNIITDEIMLDAAHVINIAETLVKLINVDDKFKDEINVILESSRIAFAYTSEVMNVTDADERKRITYDAVVETLTKMNIEINADRIDLIKTGISIAFAKSLDK